VLVLLAAMINAGHIHPNMEDKGDGCMVCQLLVNLDKPVASAGSLPLGTVLIKQPNCSYSAGAAVAAPLRSVAIRAPPKTSPIIS
jgi:hypothetical protein